MAALSDIRNLLPKVRERCPGPGYTENFALSTLKTVIRQFATRTTIWRETIPITTVADQDNYDLVTTAGTPPVQTRPAVGTKIHRIERVVPLNDDGAEMSDYSADAYRFNITEDEIVFETGNVPSEAGNTINVIVSLRPEWQADNAVFPEWILDRWGDGLAGGAVAKILICPPWNMKASAELVRASQREFNGAVIDARGYIENQGTTRTTGISPV